MQYPLENFDHLNNWAALFTRILKFTYTHYQFTYVHIIIKLRVRQYLIKDSYSLKYRQVFTNDRTDKYRRL